MQPQALKGRVMDIGELQKLVEGKLAEGDVRRLLRDSQLWYAPKDTDQCNRLHARLIDRLLGFEVQTVETELVVRARSALPAGSFEYWGPAIHDGTQTWVGLDPQTLNTPYAVLRRLCDLLKLAPGQRVVDLGAALGRLGVVMFACAPGAKFLGLEFVPQRVDEANRIYRRWGMENARCEVCDLFSRDFEMPQADVYFIYDYGRHDQINATLGQLRELARTRPFRLVARGQATNRLVSLHHPWLESSYHGRSVENFRIYHPMTET